MRQLGGFDAEVLGAGGSHRLVELGFVRVEVAGGVLVEARAGGASIASATGRGVVANTKAAKWATIGAQGELGAHRCPVGRIERRRISRRPAGWRWPARRRCRTPAGRAPRLPRRRPHR